VSPSRNVVRALVGNGIRIDTSVFKYGSRSGIVTFDYADAHSPIVPWRADEENICRRNDAGRLTEVPIYCERRWLGAFLTPNRVYRVIMTRAHRISNGDGPGRAPVAQPFWSRLARKLSSAMRKQAWKADFNQCMGRQLSSALKRADRQHGTGEGRAIPFVLIGHSKLFTRANERSLRPFLAFVRNHPVRYQFGTFSASDTELFGGKSEQTSRIQSMTGAVCNA
jgi:hypothetical protein